METKHTPTPWKFKQDNIFGDNLRIVHACFRGDMQDKTDAEFIVRVVNAHEALLKAAKDALDTLWEVQSRDSGVWPAHDVSLEYEALKIAIELAEGR